MPSVGDCEIVRSPSIGDFEIVRSPSVGDFEIVRSFVTINALESLLNL